MTNEWNSDPVKIFLIFYLINNDNMHDVIHDSDNNNNNNDISSNNCHKAPNNTFHDNNLEKLLICECKWWIIKGLN